MHNYYCKNCNNVIGKWDTDFKYYYILSHNCKFIGSTTIDSIYFLDCKNCNKFVGIECWKVCKTCFGYKQIIGEKNLFNFFLKYKKIIPKYLDSCKICDNKYNFRWQFWFFKELTFHR